MRREAAVMDEKVYFRNSFQVCVSCIVGWRYCFDLSAFCNGLCKCVMVSGGYLQKKFIEETRLAWNDVGIAFVCFLWIFKYVMNRCIWSAFTCALTEVTRLIAYLRLQHEKICTILKSLLVRTLVQWHSFNEVFLLQSFTFDGYLLMCYIFMHNITIICF